MKTALKAVVVLALTIVIAKIAYVWSALDPIFDSHAWRQLYLMLATWFNVIGPEEGDNLVMAVVLAASFLLALLIVVLGSRFVMRPLCKVFHRPRQPS